jgi:isoleucyl-tRNA synthetase
MPYACSHYPFENGEVFKNTFPGDFIAEGLDQTRGWFYTLVILGTHLFGKLPFKNCVVNGIVLAEDGKKMSKRLKNYPDPLEVINKYGADALRLYMINSPVVRAETLRFKESGVKEIVSKVLLPLWNSYKFFEGQVELLKKVENVEYKFDPEAETENTNVMDRWILASTQSLVKYINEEMCAYRLYTVVPGLLGLIDETTNWYIRFNRKRLKGEFGVDDTLHALNTLFDVLYTLVRGLAPFTPFIADLIYSRLLPYIPESLHSEDMRSVHFLPFPEVRSELFNATIERQVGRMQKVIELARQSRERRGIGLKTPLKQLVVIHQDEEYLADVRSLETYVTEELNVRDLILSSDEDKWNVQYSVNADWPVLGKKLKKDVQKVKKGLPDLSSAQCKKYLETGKITVAGIELVQGDLVVKRSLGSDTGAAADPPAKDAKSNPAKQDSAATQGGTQETNSDDDVLTILDVASYPELAAQGLAREVVNRIQQLRKKAGLKPTDDVKMEYDFSASTLQSQTHDVAADAGEKDDGDNGGVSEMNGVELEKVFEEQAKFIEKALRRPVEKSQNRAGVVNGETQDQGVILQEEQEVAGVRFWLRLLKL